MDHVNSRVVFLERIFVTDESIVTVPLVSVSTNTVWEIFTIFKMTDLFVDIFERGVL